MPRLGKKWAVEERRWIVKADFGELTEGNAGKGMSATDERLRRRNLDLRKTVVAPRKRKSGYRGRGRGGRPCEHSRRKYPSRPEQKFIRETKWPNL